jgi:hypothetical protein
MSEPTMERGITRRTLMQGIATMVGGVALTGGDRLLAFSFESAALDQAMAEGVADFSAADVALLDEIAETILPATSRPGAKAAKTGAFMALMVTEAYTPRNQQIFRDGMRQLDEACRAAANGATFMQATPAERLRLLEELDREQRTATEERADPRRSRAPVSATDDDEPRHYFRLMKELTLLGYFTSEVGYRQAMRYIETPGRFDPCVPLAPGDRSWAAHA